MFATHLAPRCIEADVEDLIVVAAQGLHATAGADIPQLAGAVNRSRDAHVSVEIELRRRDLTMVTGEGVNAPTGADLPDLHGVIKRAGDDQQTRGVEVERNDLRGMPEQCVELAPPLHVPQLGSVVHRPRRHNGALRVEREADDLRRVPHKRVVQLPRLCVPQLRRLVERSGNDLVPKWIIERNGIDDVLVPLESEQLIAARRRPDLARSIVAPRDELVPCLVERAVRQGQDVRAQDLVEVEVLTLVRLLLLNQPVDETAQLPLS